MNGLFIAGKVCFSTSGVCEIELSSNLNNISTPNFCFLYRTNAKGTPLNINKVSNSLINFGRKLISPAMAPGSAGGPAPGGGSGSSSTPVIPPRTLTEAPRHHLQQQQQQQQRLMKSESMPVQLNKGKEKALVNLKKTLSAARNFLTCPKHSPRNRS